MQQQKQNMKTIRLFLLAVITGTLSFSVPARQISPVPVDTTIRIGKLANGLTYFIRHNGEPKERASFYIIQNVGSILEEDNQNGLAHFLEHMAFNGTQNFPGQGITNILEKLGVAFGKNINAYTAYDETIYNISDVPVTQESLIDTCLLILRDWSDSLLLTNTEIDLERGVIAEEWRTRQNAAFRMQTAIQQVMFRGSKYADRDVIGDPNVIRTFKYETLRKFYKDWYRTDLQAIAVIGDIDVDKTEASIKALFGRLPAEKNPPARPFFDIPAHKETYFVKATDPEASTFSVAIFNIMKGVMPENKDLTYYRDQLANQLFNWVVADRITELLQKGQPPFISGVIMFGKFVRGYDRLFISANAKPNKLDEALRSVYTEAVRLKKFGVTPTELDRARKNLMTQTENQWKQKDKIRNDDYADAISQHFLTNDPLESMDTQWQLTQQFLPTITAEELSAKARQWISPENRVIVVVGPDSKDSKLLSEDEVKAIMKEVEESDIKPYVDSRVPTTLIEKKLSGSPIIRTKLLPEFKAVEWTLANQAKVIYRFADYQKDNVLFQAISPGGMSLYKTPELPSAMMLPHFVGNFGAGSYDAVSLNKILAGKNVSVNPSLAELNETFTGSSSPRDFEILLQLLYLKFQEPRFDREAFAALKSRYVGMIINMEKNPQKAMSDSLDLILTDHNPRTVLVTPAFFEKVTLEEMEKIYRERYTDAGDFTFFIVGNIEEANVKPLVEKYIGSLTDLPRTEKWKDNNIQFPKGKTVREIGIPLQTKKATVIIVYDKLSPWSSAENMKLSVVRDILTLKSADEVREKEGGTYGVRINGQSERFPKEEKVLQISFDTDPGKAEYLKSILYREIDTLVLRGPSAEDLDKAVKNLLKDREQAKPNNGYWMNILTGYYRYNVNFDNPENYENILKSMTVNDIRDFARQFLPKADVVDIIFKTKE
jgi:zinc protease